jgi:hypothetical protein
MAPPCMALTNAWSAPAASALPDAPADFATDSAPPRLLLAASTARSGTLPLNCSTILEP